MSSKSDQEWFRKTRAILYNEEPEETQEHEEFRLIELEPEAIEEPEEETRESLMLTIERMKHAKRFSRLNYLGLGIALILLILQIVLLYSLEHTQYSIPVMVFCIANFSVYLHYFALMKALQDIKEGKTQ